ncbi:Aste57867_17959 [Aphanomyces stellatus]|uniref:Aste57867_17959 protein n=1 Tax=Aphanomyces stellatus TaxID=120398 RepID=A0A485LA34_9STRA|nr:hypothetical protein As57867_017897 [Aphanomyces stellatus]VFT94699.1 Aste57867_17959 [Aphanomyces stellatus]
MGSTSWSSDAATEKPYWHFRCTCNTLPTVSKQMTHSMESYHLCIAVSRTHHFVGHGRQRCDRRFLSLGWAVGADRDKATQDRAECKNASLAMALNSSSFSSGVSFPTGGTPSNADATSPPLLSHLHPIYVATTSIEYVAAIVLPQLKHKSWTKDTRFYLKNAFLTQAAMPAFVTRLPIHESDCIRLGHKLILKASTLVVLGYAVIEADPATLAVVVPNKPTVSFQTKVRRWRRPSPSRPAPRECHANERRDHICGEHVRPHRLVAAVEAILPHRPGYDP